MKGNNLGLMEHEDGGDDRRRALEGGAGTAEQMGGVALFLASRASGYTTGAVIPCDGGIAEI